VLLVDLENTVDMSLGQLTKTWRTYLTKTLRQTEPGILQIWVRQKGSADLGRNCSLEEENI
jgi:hypothetical protein